MTLDQDLDSKTAFGNGSSNDPTHPWFTDDGDVDPCVRPDFTTGDFWDGTPDFLLCASLKIQ